MTEHAAVNRDKATHSGLPMVSVRVKMLSFMAAFLSVGGYVWAGSSVGGTPLPALYTGKAFSFQHRQTPLGACALDARRYVDLCRGFFLSFLPRLGRFEICGFP